jgi:hypothetical protein
MEDNDTRQPGSPTRQRYIDMNAAWPKDLPSLTGQEAVSAARRLYRLGTGKAFLGKIKLTSGNRYTWIRDGVLYVNPDGHHFGAWRDLVHDLSHLVHGHLYPSLDPHDWRHSRLERQFTEHVLSQGWLDGKLRRPDKAAPRQQSDDLRTRRYKRVVAALERAEHRLHLAQRAVARLTKRRRYYERVMSKRSNREITGTDPIASPDNDAIS